MNECSRTVTKDNRLFLRAISQDSELVVVRKSRDAAVGRCVSRRILGANRAYNLRVAFSRGMVEISEENGSSKSLMSRESPLDLLSDVSAGAGSGKPTIWLGGDRRIVPTVSPRMEMGSGATS